MGVYVNTIAGVRQQLRPINEKGSLTGMGVDPSKVEKFKRDFIATPPDNKIFVRVRGAINSDICFFQPCRSTMDLVVLFTGEDIALCSEQNPNNLLKMTPSKETLEELFKGYYTFLYGIAIEAIEGCKTAEQFLCGDWKHKKTN